LLYFQGYKGLF